MQNIELRRPFSFTNETNEVNESNETKEAIGEVTATYFI